MPLLQRLFGTAPAPLLRAAAPLVAQRLAAPSSLEADAPAPREGRLQLGAGARLSLSERFEGLEAQVDGTLQGSLRVGRLLIGRHGQVDGPVRCQEAQIRGRFDGELIVRGKLTVFATAQISGKVRCGDIQVWKGGQLQGDVQRLQTPADTPRQPGRRGRCQALFLPTVAVLSGEAGSVQGLD